MDSCDCVVGKHVCVRDRARGAFAGSPPLSFVARLLHLTSLLFWTMGLGTVKPTTPYLAAYLAERSPWTLR